MAEEDVEIENPPFPHDEASVEQIYAYVVDFAAWVDKYRPEANKYVGRECVVAPRSLPGLPVHMKLSILRLTGLFNRLRQLRCQWDGIVRMHERSWNSDKAKSLRHVLLHEAVDLLNEAYLSGEMLEAHIQEKQERLAAHQVVAGIQHAQQVVERLNKEYGPQEGGETAPGTGDDPGP